MDIAAELKGKLTSVQYKKVEYYIKKANEAYKEGRYSAARSSIEDAIAVLRVDSEYNAAYKVGYYVYFSLLKNPREIISLGFFNNEKYT